MKPPLRPNEETRRLEVLRAYDLLDTLSEQSLDDLTALAAQVCAAPIALISLVDQDRQWFKSKVGLSASEIARDISFCGHAILQKDLFIVPEAAQDERFADNPLVTQEPHIGFYAGAPLLTPDGLALGTLCVIDHVPRHLTESQEQALRTLSRQVMAQFELRRQAKILAANEERFRILTENASVGLVIVNAERRYVFANQAYAQILDLPAYSMIGRRVADVLAEVYEDQIRPRLDRAFAGERLTYDLRRPSAKGDRYFAVRYEPTLAEGTVTLVVVVIAEITGRKAAEAENERQRSELRLLLDSMPALVFYKDRESRFLLVNRAMSQLVGRPAEAYLGKTDAELGTPNAARYREDDLRVMKSGEPIRQREDELPTPGGVRWLLTDKLPLRDKDGHIAGVVGFAVDITERKRAEQALREREEQLRIYAEHSPVATAMLDREMKYLVVSRRWIEDFRLDEQAVIGRCHYEVFPEIPERWKEIHGRCLGGAIEKCDEDVFLRADGTTDWIRWEIRPWYQAEGCIGGLIIFSEDISARKKAAAALHEAGRFAQSTIDALAAHLCVLDEAGKIVATNAAWRRYAHANPTSAHRVQTGENYLQVCDAVAGPEGADANAFADGIRAVLRGERTDFEIEYPCHSPSEQRWFVGRVTRFPGAGPVHVVVAHEDITERKLAGMASLRLAAIVSSSDDAIIGKDLGSIVTNWNRGAEKIFGYTADEMVGTSIIRLIPSDRQEEETYILQKIGRGGSVEHFETQRQTKDGRLIDVSVTASPIKDGAGRIVGVSKVVRDISERKRAEKRVLWLASFPERNPNPVLELDLTSGVFHYINPTALRLFPDLPGKGLRHPLVAGLPELAGPMGTQNTLRREVAVGERFFSQVIAYLPETRRVRVYCSDITERALAEQARRASEVRYRSLFDYAPDGIVIMNPEGLFLDANASMCRMLGYAHDELVQLKILDVLAAEEIPRVASALIQIQAGKDCHHERLYRRKNGSFVTMDTIATALPDGNMLALIRDITERRQAESALRESDERFRQLAENIHEAFWIAEPAQNRMLYISPAYERIWGRTCQSLYEAPRTWFLAIHPEDRDRIELAAKTKQSSGDYDETYRITRPDGSVRWVHDRAFPLRTAAGEVHRIVGTAEDVTERRQLEEQFRQSQKMEAIGQMAGGVAHDFNNILAAIMMQADLAASAPGVPAQTADWLGEIGAAAERAASLTRQLLAFSRRQVMQPSHLDLNENVTGLTKMLQRILGEDVRLHLHLSPRPLPIWADAGMVDQVLMNLVINARDAMPEGGRLSIATAEKTITAAEAAARPDTKPGRHVCLRVADTGTGIAPENLSRIFEPFFTTKEPGQGTGLGLATVFGVVKQHGGSVTVESEVGKGTTFEVWLPALEAGAVTRTVKPAKSEPPGGTETILLVEDDAVIRIVTRAVLERAGYTVLEAPDGVEALRIWEMNRASIQLLLTDIVMPRGVSGRLLAERILARAPSLHVVFTSGYSADIAGRELALEEGQNFLQKPYSPQRLLETIRRCLDS